MSINGNSILVLSYFLWAYPVSWSVPESVFNWKTIRSDSTSSTLQNALRESLLTNESQSSQLQPFTLCASNTSQVDQVTPLANKDYYHSHGPEIPSLGLFYIKNLYKSGHSNPHQELCPSQGAKIRVLILVTSAPEHFKNRDSIRLTWGRFGARDDVVVAFVLGKYPFRFKANLTAEDQFYGDLVIGNSVDEYWSLPLKTISLLEWTYTYCPKASFVFKCDDDVFVNVPVLLNFISDRKILEAKMTIFGNIRQQLFTKRDPAHRHYIPKEESPEPMLPDFLGGPAYMLTRDAVKPMLEGACDQPFVRIEDVFTTGLLAAAVGVKIQHADEFNSDKMARMHRPVTDMCKHIATHEVRGHQMFEMWQQIFDDPDYQSNNAPQPVVCQPSNYPVPGKPRTRYKYPSSRLRLL